MQIKTLIFIFLFSLVLTIVSVLLIPKKKFKKNIVKEHFFGSKRSVTMSYYYDLDNDGILETIDFIKSKIPGNSVEIRQNNNVAELYNLRKNEEFISTKLQISPRDKNGISSIYFISALDSFLYLNILTFNLQKSKKIELKKITIDSVSLYNNKADAINYKIDFFDNNVIFNIQAGFSIYPRNIYLYNSKTGIINKTDTTSVVCAGFDIFAYENKKYILATNISASGNTISTKQYEKLEKSTNLDTIEIFNKKKYNVFDYGDFASYILLYNKDLKFEFEPIEYIGWTNYTLSKHFFKNNKAYIISLTCNFSDTLNKTYITVCNMKGEIVKQINFKKQYAYIISEPNNDYIILHNGEDKKYYIYSKELKLKSKMKNITSIIGYKDINNDGKKELVALDNHKLIIYSNNLKNTTEFSLNGRNNNIKHSTLNTYTFQGKTYFYFYTKDNYYILEYKKNNYFFVKYLIFVAILLAWFFVLYLFLKLNTKRLEADNIRLEKIVSERTAQLNEKNEVLLFQKEEIRTQADELLEKNEYLIELTNFKKNMTDTIVHDLKNPLNIILNKTSDKQITNSAKRMLNLVLNILDVERYEKTELVLNKEKFYLASILNNIVSDMKIVCDKKNISIKTPIKNYELLADKNILIRVFENLLTNAIKFAKPNSEILITVKPVTDQKMQISVFNYGETISEENIKSIFNKYKQIKTKNNIDNKSTGIGLAYCKMAIEAHESTIFVENYRNEGVIFSFLINEIPTNQSNETKKSNNKFDFSIDDIELISKFTPLLKNIEFYNVSKIFEVLNQINEKSVAVANWKKRIKSLVFSGNKEMFNKLLNVKLETKNEIIN